MNIELYKKSGHPRFQMHGILGYPLKEGYVKPNEWKHPFPDDVEDYLVEDNNSSNRNKWKYNVFGTCQRKILYNNTNIEDDKRINILDPADKYKNNINHMILQFQKYN